MPVFVNLQKFAVYTVRIVVKMDFYIIMIMKSYKTWFLKVEHNGFPHGVFLIKILTILLLGE